MHFNILRGPERATLHAKGGALKGGRKTKTLDFETPFWLFSKRGDGDTQERNASNLQVFLTGKRPGWKMLLVGDPL